MNLLAIANGFANEIAKIFVLFAEIPCKRTFKTKFASEGERNGLEHSAHDISSFKLRVTMTVFRAFEFIIY